MIKLTFCLTRLPHLSREAFQAYWRNTHAPLVASVAETLQIRRYVQLHSLPPDVSAGIRGSRNAPPEYDGVAELWFDSLEALAANARKPRRPARCCWKTNAASSTWRSRRSGGARKSPSSDRAGPTDRRLGYALVAKTAGRGAQPS
jgi:uncharacterized protein (TIGR02118 family)